MTRQPGSYCTSNHLATSTGALSPTLPIRLAEWVDKLRTG